MEINFKDKEPVFKNAKNDICNNVVAQACAKSVSNPQKECLAGSAKSMDLLQAEANNAKVAVVVWQPEKSYPVLKSELEQRLNILNLKTDDSENFTQRFGKDGINNILKYASSSENIAIINKKLDELESGENIWTHDITSALAHDELATEQVSRSIEMASTPELFISPKGAKIAGPIKELHTSPSTNPNVIALEEKMKKMGHDAYFSDNLETAEIITNAYLKMSEKGFKMPKEVLLMTPESEGILGFRPYSKMDVRYEVPIIFDKNLAAKETDSMPLFPGSDIKRNATNSPQSVVYHEIGHFLHEKTACDIKKAVDLWKNLANDGYDMELAQEVGYYAMMGDKFHSGREYVAEVFAGLMDGKQYSKRVMDLYEALGGPKF